MSTTLLGLGNDVGCWLHQGFGPAVGSGPCATGRDNFDFTLQFEQSILTIGPSGLLLAALPLRWLHLRRQSRKTQRGEILGFTKVGCIAAFGVLQVALLALWATSTRPDGAFGKVTIAANTLGIFDAVALCYLSYMEHTRSIRPSSLIIVYLFFSFVFDVAQCRTLWLLQSGEKLRTIAAIFSVSITFKLAILILEAREKKSLLVPPWNRESPESLSGTISRALYWWLNTLFLRGYKGILNLDSLWPTEHSLGSEKLLGRLQFVWDRTKDQKKKHALAFALLKSIKWSMVLMALPRVWLIGIRFSQPLLLQRTVQFVSQPESKDKRSIGYGLIGATLLVYGGNAIVQGVFNYKNIRVITMVRGALVSTVMSKALTVTSTVAAEKGSSTLTLMSADVDRILLGLEVINDAWAAPIEVGVALWLLHRELGVAFIVPALIATTCTLIIFIITPLVGKAFAGWNKGVADRVTLTSAVLGNMKEVKLLGLTDRWTSDIQKMRVRELDLSKEARILSVYRLVLMRISTYLTPAVTFGVFLAISRKHGEHLSVSKAFTSLALLSLLSNPLAYLFAAFPQTSMALACFSRIQDFLTEDDKELSQRTVDLANVPTSVSNSTDDIELEQLKPLPVVSNRESTGLLTLNEASFGVKEEGAPITHHLSLTIHRSTLTMIIGNVGSGKTTLLKGLLGELRPTAGSAQINFSGSSYCEQQPWLTNDTIQNNILGHSTLEARWYETVIKACALDKDFDALPSGDLSLIGSKGISLSGGQKARVSLARALYSRENVAIVDDMLSGLDWATEEFIWTNIFGPNGIFRQQGTTVILATHAVRHLREADNIIALGEDGSIVQQGTFKNLEHEQGYVQSLLVEAQSEKCRVETTSESSKDLKKDVVKATVKGSEEENDLLRKTGDITLYKYYFKSIGWKDGLIIFVLTFAAEFCLYFPQYWVKLWAEADSRHPGQQMGLYYGVYIGLGVIGLVFVYWSIAYCFIVITPKSGAFLHQKLLDVIMGAPLSFFVETDTGVTVNRFSQDMSLLDMNLNPGAFLTLLALMSCIMGAVLIVASMKYMAAVIPFAIAFLYFLQLFYLRTSRQLRFMDLEAKSPLYTHLLETVQGVSTIRAFGWSPAAMAASLKFLDISQRPFYLLHCIQRWLQLVLDLFVTGMAVLFVAIAVSTNTTSAGSIGLALLSILNLNQSLVLILITWTELETSLGAIARLRDMEMRTPIEAKAFEVLEPERSWPQSGNVVFDNIKAFYNVDSEPVLRNISFEIQSGHKVAICGRTGSGKSSLLLTLFRLLDLQSGDITIDTLSTTTMPRSVLRSHLNIIPQDPVIFPGSVRLNAIPSISTPSTTVGDEAIIAALTTVALWTTISSRGGLDAEMSSIPLSQGQKQLFCLARALLRRNASPILVLDEATSNVDQHTEELMQKIIREEWKGKTIIAVVHKLDTILDFDKIAVLEKGSLLEYDAPILLMERSGSAFRGLWDSQR